jgi:hypothetical protein
VLEAVEAKRASQRAPPHNAGTPSSSGQERRSHSYTTGQDGQDGQDHAHAHGHKHTASGHRGDGHGKPNGHTGPSLPPRNGRTQHVEDPGTPEQRSIVSKVLGAKDYYQVSYERWM